MQSNSGRKTATGKEETAPGSPGIEGSVGAFKTNVSESNISAKGSEFNRVPTGKLVKRSKFLIYMIHFVEIDQCPRPDLRTQII